METVIFIIQLAAVFGVPLLLLKNRDRGVNKTFGTVAMAYFWGLLVAAAVWLLNLAGIPLKLNADLGQVGSYVCIGLAIPLLMFGSSLHEIRRLTGTVLTAFALLIVSVLIAAILAGRLLGGLVPGGRELAAMAVGMYTGGTPNFNAVGVIVGAPGDVIALGNLSDMIVGTLFYVFILMAAKPILGRRFDAHARMTGYLKTEGDANNADTLVWRGFRRELVRNLLLSLGCVAVGAAIGFGIWFLSGGEASGKAMTDPLIPAVMITGTVLGLALSFVKKVREVPENGTAGQYLVLVFSFALASSLDLSSLSGGFLQIIGLLAVITVGTFLLHILLCRLFRIDADCTLVTLTAGIYGPAFIPAVTRQLKNDKLTAPGLICGALGYAVGTMLGALVYLLL